MIIMKNQFFLNKNVVINCIISIFMSGCAATNNSDINTDIVKNVQKTPLEFARGAYGLLERGERNEAGKKINEALMKFPDSAILHSSRAVLYEIDALNGDVDARRNAETGFRLALTHDPSNKMASIEYARSLIYRQNYDEAVSVLSDRLYAFPDDVEYLREMAVASYLNGDPYAAAGALDKAQQLDGTDLRATSLFSIVMAAIGDYDASANALNRLRNMDRGGAVYEYTKKRSAEWTLAAQSLGDAEQNIGRKYVDASDGINLVENARESSVISDLEVEADQGRKRKWGCEADEQLTNAESAQEEFSAGSFPARQLPAIIGPSPEYLPPSMVTIDTIFVRSEDVVGKSYGFNFLNLLKANFSISSLRDSSSGLGTVLTKAWSIFSDGNLSYSLNIANTFYNRAEVLTRPTLTTLNCRSAYFFSGQEVSVVAGGDANSGASLIEKPIGVGLTITPTIIDEETVILNIALARSFLEVASNVAPSLNQTLQTSSTLLNTSVILKFGETLIVSGIISTDRLRNKQGVPLLEKIPLVQYFTSNRTDTDNEKSVLVFITPQRPKYTQNGQPDMIDKEGDDEETRWVKRMLRKKYTPPDNTVSALAHLVNNRYYRYIRREDAIGEPWSKYRSVEGQLKILKEFLWY